MFFVSEWKECTIADLGEVVGGATPSTKKPENYENGIISWITPKDLSTFKGRFITYGERNITEIGLNSCSTRILPPHTILFSSRAPIGYVAIAAKEMCTNQGFKSVIPNADTDFMFLYYLLKYNRGNIENMGSGTTFKEVSGNTMKSIKVYVPVDIEEQRKIGAVLSAIDDKIELNTAINENLEQQARALFKKMISGDQKQVPFTSLIDVFGGGTPKTGNQEYWNGEIPFFTPKDVGNPYALTTEKSITSLGLDNCNSHLYPVNTVFLTARGTVGKVSLAGVPMAMNQSCYALTGKDGLHQIIVYQYVLETVKALKHKASGAVFDAIITRDFDTEIIPVLSSEQIDDYIAVAAPIYSEIRNRTFENRCLAALRDSLLPKLMSGEIDVSQVQI